MKPTRRPARRNRLALARSALTPGRVEDRIGEVRGVRIMLDGNLAAFYGVTTSALTHRELARRLDELERRTNGNFAAVFEAIRELMDGALRTPPRRCIGFQT